MKLTEKERKLCLKCMTPSTRPRVVLKNGICNACLWAEEKKTINWRERWARLEMLCDIYRRNNDYDCIVPVSGGKDGSYVAWKMKHELGMHPLCVTFSPPIQTKIGRKNLENFRNSGFDLIEIRPDPNVYRTLCKKMFIEQARSKFPFVIAIGIAPVIIAKQMGINLLIYGEEGETEYGGSDKYKNTYFITPDYLNIYRENNDLSKEGGFWWTPPQMNGIKITWWSKYENWDDQLHRDLAIEKCGLQTTSGEIGTFTNYAQIDDILQDLLQYEMFIKYGHGRATADCNLAIHAGRMTRKEAVKIVNEMDGIFPLKYLDLYCDYFEMTRTGFWNVIKGHVNFSILKETGSDERPFVLKELIK